MLTPSVAVALSQFYPLGNTPAANLALNLPQGIDGNVLLLGCGDLRNILYTSYVDSFLPTRKLDVTCCDADQDVLARNVLLLSFIIDGKVQSNALWNVYYHLYLSESDVEVLSTQVNKVLKASESQQAWKASPYGKSLQFCDRATFDDVRVVWTRYQKAVSCAASDASAEDFKASLKHSQDVQAQRMGRTQSDGSTLVLTAMRSAAPLAMHTQDEIPHAFAYFAEHGVTGRSTAALPNPLFSAAVSDHKALHYGTDPALGFHLAAAFVPLSPNSPLRFERGREKFNLIAAAKVQFEQWTKATANQIKSARLVVRFTSCDALNFCHALQHHAITQAATAGFYRRQFDSRTLELDTSQLSSPGQFDVIDSSNLADSVGALNIFIAAVPLLARKPWATLMTETLLKGGDDSAKASLDTLLCGDSQSVSTLLGITPVETWTNATNISKVDEVMLNLMSQGSESNVKDIQSHNRMSWKLTSAVCGNDALPPLSMTPEQLASFAYHTYLKMFPLENAMALLSAGMANLGSSAQAGYAHFHRGTFVALLKYLKQIMPDVDFEQTCVTLDKYVAKDQTLAFGSNLAQDMAVHLHTKGLWSPPWMSGQIQREYSLGGFNAWKSIPEVVAVTLVVPRGKINRLFDDAPRSNVSSPTFIGSLTSGPESTTQWHNMYGDVHLAFGSVATKGCSDSEAYSLSIKEDPTGWSGGADLVASFYVPVAALQADQASSAVGIEVQATPQNIAIFRPVLGESMSVFKTPLNDGEKVFLSKHLPGQKMFPVVCGAAGAGQTATAKAEASKESKTSLTADGENGKISTLTGHIDVLSAKGKKLLIDKVPIDLKQVCPFVINVVFGNNDLVLSAHFPVPVDGAKLKSRVARKSSYIEIIVPFASPVSSSVLTDYVFPTVLYPAGPKKSMVPVTLNSPHVSLDGMPIIDLSDKGKARFLTTLTSFQFSVREKKLREGNTNGLNPSPRVNFKESLFTMFMLASGLQGGQTGLFAINHPERGGIHMLILISAIRLDSASASVALDAAVMPFTEDMITGGEIEDFLLLIRSLEICSLTVDDAELAIWKKVLPAFVERARTWSHRKSCEYTAQKRAPLSVEPGDQPLCSCGRNTLPNDFIAVPEWEKAKKFATRAAISPTYALPYLEETVDTSAWKASGRQIQLEKERCANCGAEEAKKTQGGELKKCRGCMRVKYCSVECQKKDWKKHRGECEV